MITLKKYSYSSLGKLEGALAFVLSFVLKMSGR